MGYNGLILPWPDPALSPNRRRSRVSLTKNRQAAKVIGMKSAQDHDLHLPADKSLKMEVYIHPPNKTRRDMDNVLSSLKYYIDGIFFQCGVDDSKLDRIELIRCKVKKGGGIVLIFSWDIA